MNKSHLQIICERFKLGRFSSVQSVSGGLLHNMWRVATDKKSYAIKQLSHSFIPANNELMKKYELSERIASRFCLQEIPALHAIEQNGEYLTIIDETGYLVYPWVETVRKRMTNEQSILQISAMMAKMHHINLMVPEILTPEFDLHTDDKIVMLAKKAKAHDCSFASDLNKKLPNLLLANDVFQSVLPSLKKNVVISHGDLHQKNILWNESGPIIIDWELVGKFNPIYELVNTSLDWSNITAVFNKTLFAKMIEVYAKAGGIIDAASFKASFYGVFGYWLNWIVYNIERTFNKDLEQKKIGVEQVNIGLATILKLENLIPELINIF